METKLNFEHEFTSLCDLLGEKSTNLFQLLGQPDDIDANADRTFVCYNSNHSFWGFNDNLIFTLQMPIADSFGHHFQTDDLYFTFNGLKLGMSKDDVISTIGQPLSFGTYRWVLQKVKTSYGNDIDISIEFRESEEDVFYLSSFDAHLIEKEPIISSSTQKPKSGCFIATACYGDYNSEEVLVLREFRDNVLLNSLVGKLFVRFYYFTSPPIAQIIEKYSNLKTFIRNWFLSPIIRILKKQ